MDTQDLALSSLAIFSQLHSVPFNIEQIKHKFAIQQVMTKTQLLLAAKDMGFKVKASKKEKSRLALLHLPILVWRDDGKHFILAKVDTANQRFLIHDLETNQPIVLSDSEFSERYSGEIIQFTSRASVIGQLAKFDFTWFIPAIVKYRRIFLEVILVSIVLQVFALITPLFFQVVMDKVLVHQGFGTLNVVAIALCVVSIFEIVLSAIRTYVFSHTTSRIDVELGAKLFRHLLSLPIAYFEARRVGDTVARVRELEQIRTFLTGQALTSVLDLLFSFIFLAVMWYYSIWLTLVVLISLPCYAMWSAFISPILRRRLNEKFARNADNQAFLVESVAAMGTIKSMAVTPQMTEHWDKQLSGYVQSSFKVTKIATIGQHGIQLIQKLVMVINLWLGAHLVIAGELTVGQLIAFNMLASQVAAPVIRLAQFWQDFQQVGISVSRLGDILNTPTENPQNKLVPPEIKGDITFKEVTFRYRPDGKNVINDVSLSIRAGEIIGIVGRSGSGKSTLTKLIQRMYAPSQGNIFIDGNDIALVEPSWLRRQIGVVLQDNILLNRSIRDNIALSSPSISMEHVMRVAKLAGAHEFISQLPEGYDTLVGEHGANLSGGQKQRIAIARALVNNPRILIFDEATSALDYESEHIIMKNMQYICRNRTVIIIAHRLSTVNQANRIIVMDQGTVVEQGNHQTLLAAKGLYHYLYQLQATPGSA